MGVVDYYGEKRKCVLDVYATTPKTHFRCDIRKNRSCLFRSIYLVLFLTCEPLRSGS